MKKCDRCKILFDALIEEYEEKGIVEQYTICPRCKHKNSIIFYDEYLDNLIEKMNEALKVYDETHLEIINYKKRIKNLANYLKTEAIRRNNGKGCYIRIPENLEFI